MEKKDMLSGKTGDNTQIDVHRSEEYVELRKSLRLETETWREICKNSTLHSSPNIDERDLAFISLANPDGNYDEPSSYSPAAKEMLKLMRQSLKNNN